MSPQQPVTGMLSKRTSERWPRIITSRQDPHAVLTMMPFKIGGHHIEQWFPNWGPWPPGGHGAIAREPWAHLEKIYFSRIDTEIWTFWNCWNCLPIKM